MIVCPNCSAVSESPFDCCRQCRFVPARIDGFVAWAPEVARQFEGFPSENFDQLARIESENFWFRARNELIVWALQKYFPAFGSLLEVGCGTGFVLSGIAGAAPHVRLVGSEMFTAGLCHAALRAPGAELVQMDARHLPYREEFDVVAAFDVIEHVKEDQQILDNLFRATRPGGGCLISVPQHRWLWSAVDVAAHHERRYTAGELHERIERAGFRVRMSTSFVSLLLPAMLLSRSLNRPGGKTAGRDELQPSPMINRIFKSLMDIERQAIRWGIRWPAGGSRLVVATRPVGTEV